MTSTNEGVRALNDPDPTNPRTVVVIGLPRSGTSMVASVLDALGIPMGDKYHPARFEDWPLSTAFEEGRIDDARAIIADRDARFDVWAWKRPGARKYLDTVDPELRCPHYIAVFRDPLACAGRMETLGHDLLAQLSSFARAQQKLVSVVTNMARPLLLVSYEKAVLHPDHSAGAIAEFAGVEAAADAVSAVEADCAAYISALQT